jgi:uncharacterized membrane protein YidH (DUF202 family)
METRIIIAYSLIAIMAALVAFGGVMWRRNREKMRRKNAGHGTY